MTEHTHFCYVGGPYTIQRGVALITAVLIVAIVATVAVFVGLHQQIWLRQTQNLMDRAQATAIHQGSLFWASQILAKDAKNSTTDNLTEDWAKPLPPLPVEGGVIVASLSDAQARFNLNNLWQNNKPSTEYGAVFQRLLEQLGLDPVLKDTLIDWLDGDPQTRPNGAEDIEYLNSEPPYRAANRSLESVEELRLVKGFDAATVDMLRPYVVALPNATTINVNTAPNLLLAALVQGLSTTTADEIVSERGKTPFKQLTDFEKLLSPDQKPQKGTYDLKSSYFLANIDIQIGRLRHRTEALIQRGAGGQSTHALWQRPRTIQVILKKEEDSLS